jgi:hypothetical protein
MYLARFFHRPPGDDDRLLLLALDGGGYGGDDILMGIHMKPFDMSTSGEFLREEFAETADAIRALRRHAEELRAAGFIETHHINYTLRTLLPDVSPKPDWQLALDEAFMRRYDASDEDFAAQLAALAGTAAVEQPMYYLLVAERDGATGQPEDRRHAEQAHDRLLSFQAAGSAQYRWSLRAGEIEALIFTRLARACLQDQDPAAALEAAEDACKACLNQGRTALRATILCDHYPEMREEVFDEAFRYARHGGYEAITRRPDYQAYAARRGAAPEERSARWSARTRPASEAAIAAAEAALGVTLPAEHRAFLAARGETDLLIRHGTEGRSLRFHAADDLARERDSLTGFMQRIGIEEGDFQARHGIAFRHLLPMATLDGFSSDVLIHLEPGARHGWCYLWSHDDPFELEFAQPGFEAMLDALRSGIESDDPSVLAFLELNRP